MYETPGLGLRTTCYNMIAFAGQDSSDMVYNLVQRCKDAGIQVLQDSNRLLFKAKDLGAVLQLGNVNSSLVGVSIKDKVLISNRINGGLQKLTYLTCDGAKQLVCRSRSVHAPKLAKLLGIVVIDNMYVPVETSAVNYLLKVFEGLTVVPQYNCMGYRIDLYFPIHKVAVECDEEGAHGPGRISKDHLRQAILESELCCKFVRFRPQQKGFDYAVLVHQCLVAMQFV